MFKIKKIYYYSNYKEFRIVFCIANHLENILDTIFVVFSHLTSLRIIYVGISTHTFCLETILYR